MRSILLSLLLSVAMTASSGQAVFSADLLGTFQRESAVYQLCSRAQTLMKQDKFSEAIRVLSEAASKGQTSYSTMIRNQLAYCYLARGHELQTQGKLTEAKSSYQKAASFDPTDNSAPSHGCLAYVLRNLGELDGAIAEGKKALQLDPTMAATMYTIGFAYADKSQFDEAISWLQRYLTVEKDPAGRQAAQDAIKGFTDDRSLSRDSSNESPDYYSLLRSDHPRWPQKNLPLKVAILPGNGVYGYKPEFPNLVKNALDTWCQAAGKRLDYKVVSAADDADIKVTWTKDPLEITLDHANVQPDGLTQRFRDSEGNITRADVQIRTVNPFHPEQPVKEGECAHIVMHEIGHALGLDHSKKITDVMYFRSSEQQSGPPTSRDRATLARLYSDYPVLAFVPKLSPGVRPITYLPPPSFLPPPAPDSAKIRPPMFLPPPLSKQQKFVPPTFTPPPVSKPETQKKAPVTPFFIPPPAR